jgi:hypothetical protein
LKPISPLVITLWVVASALVGFGYSQWAVNNGLEIPISAIALSLSTALIGIILFVMAVPIWKYKRNLVKVSDNKPKLLPVNPFYAVRVLTLAKAAAITSGMFIGWHAGVVIKQLTAPVVVQESMTSNITAIIASVFLLVVAFVVEQICKLPSDKTKDV